jgi:hypothetical protein
VPLFLSTVRTRNFLPPLISSRSASVMGNIFVIKSSQSPQISSSSLFHAAKLFSKTRSDIASWNLWKSSTKWFLSCKFKLGLPFQTFLNLISEHIASFVAIIDTNDAIFCRSNKQDIQVYPTPRWTSHILSREFDVL